MRFCLFYQLKTTDRLPNVPYCQQIVGCGATKKVKSKKKNSKNIKKSDLVSHHYKLTAHALATALIKYNIPFPKSDKMPLGCLDHAFEMLHLAKSSQKSFRQRLQNKFKRNKHFKKEIEKHYLQLLKKSSRVFNSANLKQEFEEQNSQKSGLTYTTQLMIYLSVSQIKQIDNLKNRNQMIAMKSRKNYIVFVEVLMMAVCMYFVKHVRSGFIQNVFLKRII